MSLSSALSNALSGLNVSSRAADVVSSNIANALTEGYGVRRAEISARISGNAGKGARVVGIMRHENAALLGQQRRAGAELAFRAGAAGFLTRMEALVGTPDQPGSLTARTAAFETALVAAANTPENEARLAAAVEAASALAAQINTISEGIDADRLAADAEIAREVDGINEALQQLERLNLQIRKGQGGGRDVSALMDAQAQLIDRIAPLIPLHVRRDDLGAVQIFSSDGQALLDGRAAVLEFSPSPVMAPHLTRASGDLSGLSLNGRDLPLDGARPALGGGGLAALFARRDADGEAAHARIDAVARDLAERFQQSGLDPTVPSGAPGLFTDGGARFDAQAETGFAARLRVNAAVRPDQGGAVWRLRDGLGATAEGPQGQSALLQAQLEALGDIRPTASGGFSSASRSFSGLVSDHLTGIGLARQTAETDQSHVAARHTALTQGVLAEGVDTDAEMQRLLQIEQVFAANARVVAAAGEMIDELVRMG